MLIKPRRIRLGLAAGGMLTGVVLAASVAGPAAAAQAAATAPTAAVAGLGIPASAKSQLASEMTAAWQLTDGHGVTIALLDTQVSQISELAGKLTIGPNYAPLPGASTVDGTVIASMIAGSGTTTANAFGRVGRAPGARVLSESIGDFSSKSALEQHYEDNGVWQPIVAKAIRYAVDHGASVIVETESGGDSPVLDAAVAYAISKNAVVIGTTLPGRASDASDFAYPDSLPGVINFSGTTISGLPAPQNHEQYATNASVLVTAPDNQLGATGPGDQYYSAWDYDSAVAWVAGTVALIKSLYPQISPAGVATALAMSASYPPAGGYDTTIGYGLINPVGALHEAASLVRLHATAEPGLGVLSAGARFAAAPPATIRAVQHSVVKLAGFGGAIAVGAALLAFALTLRARGRRARPGQDGSSVGAGPPPEAAAAPLEPA